MSYQQPSYPNPFKKARQIFRMSQDHVARETGLSRLYVIRTEQGVYPTPSDRLINFFLIHIEDPDFTTEYFTTEYREYQRRCRLSNGPGEIFSPLPSVFSGFWTDYWNEFGSTANTDSKLHPFRYWMNQSLNSTTLSPLSVMEVCKAYCISPSLMQRFLQQPYMVHTVPGNVAEALLEAGYSREVVGALDAAYGRYRRQLYGLTGEEVSNNHEVVQETA